MTSQQSHTPQKKRLLESPYYICELAAILGTVIGCALFPFFFLSSSPIPFLLSQHWTAARYYYPDTLWDLCYGIKKNQRGIPKILGEISFQKHYFCFRVGLNERRGKAKEGQLQFSVCTEGCCSTFTTSSMRNEALAFGSEPTFWCCRASGQL